MTNQRIAATRGLGAALLLMAATLAGCGEDTSAPPAAPTQAPAAKVSQAPTVQANPASVEGYLDAALEWAGSFAAGAVVAMGLSKRAVDGGLDGPLAEGLDLERTLFGQVLATEDAAIGIKSFFENGPGKATFSGR